MNRLCKISVLGVLVSALLGVGCQAAVNEDAPASPPATPPATPPLKMGVIAGSAQGTQLERTAQGFRLLRAGQPYWVRGAGIRPSSPLDELSALGANSVRTWGAQDAEKVLEVAEKNGLTVCAGLWMGQPRQGFNYKDAGAVAAQKERVRQAVEKMKHSPALLLWGLGNEMEGDGSDPQIFQALNDAAKLIKQLDPHHPVMTVFAEINPRKIENFNRYCPDIDILGINSYGGLPTLNQRLSKLNFDRPFLVTEWGARGPWEVGKTAWQAPLEQNSSERAASALTAYKATIEDNAHCLGSYVFLWGHKQERTGTWFGLRLVSGEKTELADELSRQWTGRPIERRTSPVCRARQTRPKSP